MALPSRDGTTVFVSVDSDVAGNNGIEILRRDGASLRFYGFVPTQGHPGGLSLTPDGSTLFVADGDGVAAISASAAQSGAPVTVHYLRAPAAGTIEVQSSADGAYVFFTNEWLGSVGVAQFTAGQPQPWRFVGAISADRGPVGMALSPDGNWLYVTSEIKLSAVRPCYQSGGARAAGTLRVIDARKAYTDPAQAMVAVASAGCSPVRVALSPDGASAFVTARGDDAVIVFDTQTLRSNPNRAQRTTFGVGRAPVGIAMIGGGSRAIIADSNRFSGGAGAIQVLDPARGKNAVLTTFAAGAFPREIRESPQRDAVYVTNYGSQTVEVIPETAIP